MAADATEDEARLAIPMGVIGETGETPPELTADALRNVRPESAAVLARSQRPRAMVGVTAANVDPKDLKQSGWGVLFASDADPKIKECLQPLLDWRQQQVQNDTLFRVFEGPDGVRPGQRVSAWAQAKGVTLAAPVLPRNGVPYYLLVVGPPSRIPFEFQQQLDLQWAVGRLHFDNIDDYAAYAAKVIEYEKGASAPRGKQIALWMPRNLRDLATPMLAGTLGTDFLGKTPAPRTSEKLGSAQGFKLTPFIGEGQATKARLTSLLRGDANGGPPAIIFTGSHGAEWSTADPDRQRRLQGALVTQEWARGQPLDETMYFSGGDVAADARVHGLMVFMFACFGGACPANDSYFFNQDGTRKVLAPQPLMAQLPQALLARGTLAVIAHIDRAFSYGFQDTQGTPQAQLLRDPLERLMNGDPVGLALDPLNAAWASLAAELGMVLSEGPAADRAAAAALVNLTIARDDARNYIVLGDPAVRLDVKRLQ